MARALCLALVCLALVGCQGIRPRTLYDAAQIMCELFFSEQAGISVEEAAKTACKTEEQLRPFLEQAIAAQQAAGAARTGSAAENGSAPAPPPGDPGADAGPTE